MILLLSPDGYVLGFQVFIGTDFTLDVPLIDIESQDDE